MGCVLAFAIIVALLLLTKHPKAVPVSTGTEVLVAAMDLHAGDILKAEDVKWIKFPDNATFGGVITKKDQPADDTKLTVYGKTLNRDVQLGEPITNQVFASQENGNYLAASLHPGMRAVAIAVRPETTAGGFILPGDYVDVILNFQVQMKGDAANYSDDTVQRFASETILSNVHVMAVDQDAKGESHEARMAARTVTLEVNKQGGQVLAMASTMGQLSLALRRLGEKDTDADGDTPLTTDVSTSKVIQKIYRTEAAGGSKSPETNVRVYSGNSVTNVPVRAAAPAGTGD